MLIFFIMRLTIVRPSFKIALMTEHEMRREDMLLPFVDVIVSAREAHGISKQELALRAGFSKKYVWLVEHGHRLPPLESMIVLCAAAQVPRKKVEKMLKEVMDKVQWLA